MAKPWSKKQRNERGALFVGLDVANLTTIGTLALSTSSSCCPVGGRRWRPCIVCSAIEMYTFAFFTSKATFFILL